MKHTVKTGIDIVDIKRIEKLLNNKREIFLEKIFTEAEINYILVNGYKANTVSGMFATKEAISKLIGSGIGRLNWKDIEVLHDESGKPFIKKNKDIKRKMNDLSINDIDISISHENDYAVSIAIGVGFPNNLESITNIRDDINIEIPQNFKNLLPKRYTDTHKGTYGRVGIIAGSRGMTGAAYLTSQAALRTGSGLVYSLVPESIQDIMSIKLTEAIIRGIRDNNGQFTVNSIDGILNEIKDMNAIAIGPGMGVDDDRVYLIQEIIKNYNNPIVLDADAINCLSFKPNILYDKSSDIIITPHPGELARLLEKDIEEIQQNRSFYSKYISNKYNIIVALKGANTLVACPEEEDVYINTTGNPGMATAGSGDVLTGILVSLLGQGIKPTDATKLSVFLHGLAGDYAERYNGEYSLIATDIIGNISKSIKKIQE